ILGVSNAAVQDFAVLVALTVSLTTSQTCFQITDGSILAARRSEYLAYRAVAYGLAKIVLLFVLAAAGVVGLFGSYTLPLLAITVVSLFLGWRMWPVERERRSDPPPRALVALDRQLDSRFHVFPSEPPRTLGHVDFHRRESRRLLLHRLATRRGPQLHPGVGVEVPLRARLDPRPPAEFADVEHAPPPRGHHGPDGGARCRAGVHRHDDRRRDRVRSALSRAATVPPRDVAEGWDPTVQSTIQRGPPPGCAHRDGQHARAVHLGILDHRPRVAGPSRLAAARVGPRRAVDVGGRLVALSAADSDQARDPSDVGLKGNRTKRLVAAFSVFHAQDVRVRPSERGAPSRRARVRRSSGASLRQSAEDSAIDGGPPEERKHREQERARGKHRFDLRAHEIGWRVGGDESVVHCDQHPHRGGEHTEDEDGLRGLHP